MLAAATDPAMIGVVAATHGDRYILRGLASTCRRRALGDGVHDVWCRKDQISPWAFQVMLDEARWSGLAFSPMCSR